MSNCMTQRITFVATEELAAFLEREAERRLTTKSSVAQQLLAETYLREFTDNDSATGDADEEVELIRKYEDSVDFDMKRKFPWRVTLPDDFPWERKYDYFKNREETASALRRLYE